MKESGYFIITDPGSDKPILEGSTAQCCHCGAHFPIQPGSGKLRGWCTLCCAPICGPSCMACVPTEQLLENLEKGRPEGFRPIIG